LERNRTSQLVSQSTLESFSKGLALYCTPSQASS